MTAYQWYPGHMTKARRMMQDNISAVDLVLELTDARAPVSGRNPDIDELAGKKARILILGKQDLADPAETRAFLSYYAGKNLPALALDLRSSSAVDQIRRMVLSVMKERMEKDRLRGIQSRPVRAMVAGIPNVGKSTLINTLAGQARARTGNQPGVTRGKQWISINRLQLDLLDTPGILWPKIEDPQTGARLAMLGTIRDEVLDEEQLAAELLTILMEKYPGNLQKRYPKVDFHRACSESSPAENLALLESIARSRGLLLGGGIPDTQRAARLLLDEFRSGRIGRITLDPVPQETVNE